METSYAPLEGNRASGIQRQDAREDKRAINTTSRYAIYGSLLLLIIIASAAFWGASRNQPLLFSLSATQSVENHAKSLTFVWTLIGTILAFATGTLFNHLLKISIQQRVAQHGLKIGLLECTPAMILPETLCSEFWSRLYSRKWLHDHRSGRLFLSVFSVVFAIACGLLVSAYTGLITPTKVYVDNPLWASELDLSSDAFWDWFSKTGEDVLDNCTSIRTYGKGADALTLAMCPQVVDPLPYVSAGLASIESKHARYSPTTNVLGISFNGTTGGVLPQGWNSISYFNTIPSAEQPPVLNYNYSMIQQGVSANVSCQTLGLKSNITWLQQGEFLVTTTNGATQEEIFMQNLTFGPNKAVGIDYQSNLLLSGPNYIATFSSQRGPNDGIFVLELASYGSYRWDWKFPNMSCTIVPYITTNNVTYNNATGLFASEVVSVPGSFLRIPYHIAEVSNWLFRVTETQTGNQIINSIIALQNTPSYESGIFANVTINWPNAMELLLQGIAEYSATRLRMILTAEINSTYVNSAAQIPTKGFVASWRLGYNGETAPIATLFPLQGFILLCAITVVFIGARTGVSHVSTFDPTNTTHLIVASALGGRNGGLGALRGENAIHADAKALNLKIEYKDLHGFQEVNNLGEMEYTELQEHSNSGVGDATPSPKPALFARRPFMRTTTG